MIPRWLNRGGVISRSGTARDGEAGKTAFAAVQPLPSPLPKQTSGPAFARRAPVGGEDGLLVQPSLARSPFTPTRPVRSEAALVGRRRQVERAISGIEVERAHLAIFGERGHGKTSLANIVADLAEAAGYGVVRHSCSARTSFSDLITAVLDKVPPRFLRRAAGNPTDAPIPSGPLPDWNVAQATAVLERIRAGHLLVFIDEFDRLINEGAKREVTELLKNTSDLALRVSFVLIGVAESVGELLALHQSIYRSLVAIPVPLLTDADISVLIEAGCKRLSLHLDPIARDRLLLLSHQSPYYAQLLGLHATDATLGGNNATVTRAEVDAAARLVLEETRHIFEPLLTNLPQVSGSDGWSDLLFEAARAPCDGFGWFDAAAVHQQYGVAEGPVTGEIDIVLKLLTKEIEFALAALTTAETGPILRVRHEAGRTEFAFAHVNLRNHLLLRDAQSRRISS